MSKYLSILVALVVTLFTANALAFTPPPAPQKGWYVYDGTGQLTATQISALNHKIERISQSTKNEFGIAFSRALMELPLRMPLMLLSVLGVLVSTVWIMAF